ncbi:MAG: membrane protein insertase YidC [Gammaproteobacteria bacterium]|nr:membrane protein insertase YidC [Gammaproteobacteria bacterium]
MDNQRLLVWAAFGLMAWITFQTWQQDYGPQPVEAVVETTESALATNDDGLPELSAPAETTLDAPIPAGPAPQIANAVATDDAPLITVTTDVFTIEISTRGGTIQAAELKNYPVAKDRPDDLVELLGVDASNFGAIQSGLRIVGDGDEPNHLATFSSASNSYEMNGADELVVPLTWQSADGVSVEKRFLFRRGEYAIVIEQEIVNNTGSLWRGAEYSQIQRTFREQERSMFDVDSYSFAGPIIYDGEKSEKLQHDDLLEDGAYTYKSQAGWLGAIEHHFLSAIVPLKGSEQSYSVSVRDDRSTASMIGQAQSVAPGARKVFTTTAFVGPKLQSQLEEIDESLTLTVDYGWLTIISQPLFWLLSVVFEFVRNWGVAIIVVTFLIKLAFYKLTESSGRSMAKMRNLQPRMKALQDRYKDDRPALSQAMMELYKREKVNPAAGCLPILIQMPFFLAFYWVLLESVEMRQAPFALWITDLSTRDPYFILPLIMGAAMLMQQKLNPAPTDPVQAKVMQIMPIMFTGFFAFFPSGLVLYWVTNTLLSIAQQWKINRVVEKEAKAAQH